MTRKAYLQIEFDEQMGHKLTSAIARLEEYGYLAKPAETLNREAVEKIIKEAGFEISYESVTDKLMELAVPDKSMQLYYMFKTNKELQARVKELEEQLHDSIHHYSESDVVGKLQARVCDDDCDFCEDKIEPIKPLPVSKQIVIGEKGICIVLDTLAKKINEIIEVMNRRCKCTT